MSGRTLIDASVLVAAFNARDPRHAACVRAVGQAASPALTTWPVLTEAFYLLRRYRGAVSKIIALVRKGDLSVEPPPPGFLDWYEAYAATYADREVDLADASLVRLAELRGVDTILTLDRKDFSVYRIGVTGAFRILPEDAD
ncbi:type II toxin-antitoxin system VapC family toxin [Alienimonas chondri]|uniref:Ribonuclease VapC n=1 Tax=Alienimonas chondri TaxID=2681879 RepID=A0ABX1VHE3_9PLAN|nr:PIN domain-containing protein [Alienimonas chondri]NNJ27524.1 Ribonuclease VapC26 [Alienimonas chondri]